MAGDITTVVVHYNTPELLEESVTSFLYCYPEMPLLLIDNGSDHESRQKIAELTREYPTVEAELLDDNYYHGPAMHLAVDKVDTPYIFYLDSDTRTDQGGFLEKMKAELEKEEHYYAIGRLKYKNARGFEDSNGFPVLSAPYMMIKKKHYATLAPFIHHGTPAIRNFGDAYTKGLKVLSFPVEEYIHHKGRGTVEHFGYNLGLKGKLDYLLNKLGL